MYILKLILAAVFPWLILLLNDNPGGAILALIMQASVIGWIPASICAIKIVREQAANDKQQIKLS